MRLFLLTLSISTFLIAEKSSLTKEETEQAPALSEKVAIPTTRAFIEINKPTDEDVMANHIGCIATGLLGAYILLKSCDFKTRRIQYANESVLQDFLSNIFPSHSIKVDNGVITVTDRFSLSKLVWMGMGTVLLGSAIKCYLPSKKAESSQKRTKSI